MAKRTNKTVVAEVCLYGNSEIGAGWLASVNGIPGILGDGEPKAKRSFTQAVFEACESIRKDGITSGLVTVTAPGGEWEGDVGLNRPCYYGDIQWRPAKVYVFRLAGE